MNSELTASRAYNTNGNAAIPTGWRHHWREFHVKRAVRTPGLGERIQEARLGLSHRRKRLVEQKELAEMMGVSPATISSWESGAKEPRIETLRRLAEVLGVDRDWLTYGERDTAVADAIDSLSTEGSESPEADETLAELEELVAREEDERRAKGKKPKGSGRKGA
jgi:transcriptional regulator with XRE-family HTH domain